MSEYTVSRQPIYRQSMLYSVPDVDVPNSDGISGLSSTFQPDRPTHTTESSQSATQQHSYQTAVIPPSELVNKFNSSGLTVIHEYTSQGDTAGAQATTPPDEQLSLSYKVTPISAKDEKVAPPPPPVRYSTTKLTDSSNTENSSTTSSVTPSSNEPTAVNTRSRPPVMMKPKVKTDEKGKKVVDLDVPVVGSVDARLPPNTLAISKSSDHSEHAVQLPAPVDVKNDGTPPSDKKASDRVPPAIAPKPNASNTVDKNGKVAFNPPTDVNPNDVRQLKKFSEIQQKFEFQNASNQEIPANVKSKPVKATPTSPDFIAKISSEHLPVQMWSKDVVMSFTPVSLSETTVKQGGAVFHTNILSKLPEIKSIKHGHLMVFLGESKPSLNQYTLTNEMIAYFFVALNIDSATSLVDGLIDQHHIALSDQIRLITYLSYQQICSDSESASATSATSATLQVLQSNSLNVDFIRNYLPLALPVQWAIKNKDTEFLDWMINNLPEKVIFAENEKRENVLFDLYREMKDSRTDRTAKQQYEISKNRAIFKKLLQKDPNLYYIKSFNNNMKSVFMIAKKEKMEKELRKLHPHWK